jgi:capsular polysaccharide biosynthesis protein
MDPRELLWFIRRRAILILGGTLLCFLLALAYSFQTNHGTRSAQTFVTLGMDFSSEVAANYFDANEGQNVIDQFTETVQGWLLNPVLLADVESAVGYSFETAVRKQEKQNLIVDLTTDISNDPEVAATELLGRLDREISRYNEVTQSTFLLALDSTVSSEKAPNHFVFAGVVGGLVFVLLVLLGLSLEYLRRRVSFSWQVEQVVGEAPLTRLSRRLSSESLNDWLMSYREFLVSTGDPELIFEHTQLLSGRTGVFVVRLGETSEDELRDLCRALGESFPYVLLV